MIRPGIRRLFALATGRRPDDATEVREEIEYHLQQRVEQLVREGLDPGTARAEAERRFGTASARSALAAAARHRVSRVRLRERLGSIGFDLRYALRGLRREPAFTGFVVITLGLGIGANVAIFGVADRLLLSGPAQVTDPDRLVRFHLRARYPDGEVITSPVRTFVAYETMRDQTRRFDGVAAYTIQDAVVGRGAESRLLRAGWASADLFPVLGTRPLRGRFFTAEEDDPRSPARVAVISHQRWIRDHGGDPAIMGQPVWVADERYTIIGVAPPGFTGPELAPVDLWLPISIRGAQFSANWRASWGTLWLFVVGRLKPGVSFDEASRDATEAHQRSYAGSQPWMGQASMVMVPNAYTYAGRERAEARVARWLVGTAAVVLLIACANVVNLLLARSVRRRREVAVRVALGAGRGRLLRLLFVEGVALALLGGMVGLGVAAVLGGYVQRVLLPGLAGIPSVMTWRTVLVALGITGAVGLLVALLPAVRSSRPDLTGALKAGGREGGVSRSRVRVGLTVLQVALSVILLAGAGLFVRSLWTITRIDLGLEPERVLVADLYFLPMPPGMSPEARAAERDRRERLYRTALTAVTEAPETEHASIALGLPYHSSFGVALRVPGRDTIPSLPGGGPYISAVTADHFATIGTPILAGRAFTDADRQGSEPVVIVNQRMAADLWPGRNALGECLLIGPDAVACSRVVGIAADVHKDGFREEPSYQYYVPLGQEAGFSGSNLLVRPRGAVTAAVEPLRRRLLAVDAAIAHVGFRTLQASLDPQLRSWRLGAALFTLCGVLALVVTAVGLYSVLAYLVTDRTHEIGVRMALGATGGAVIRLVVRDGATLAMVGAVIGLAVGFAAGGWIEPLLFETSGRDPLVFGVVGAILVGVALLASLLPARRAARISPMTAIREE